MDNSEKNQKEITFKGFILGVIVSLAVFCLINFIITHIIPASDPSSIASVEKTKEIENLIDDKYMGNIDKQLMTDYMYLGLVAGLEDRYSTYYTKEEYENIESVQSGYFEGIGIELVKDEETGLLMVYTVFEDSPAEEAGMMSGDLVIEINGVDVTGYEAGEAVDMIKEDDSGVVNMTVRRGEEELEFSMTRDKVVRKPVVSEVLEDNMGYIKIGTFDSLTSEQFKTKLDGLKEAGIKSLIIDLRDNRGGLVSAACDTLREFLPEGLIVYTEDKYGERKEYTCDGENELDLPMVLLVNGTTASSAEIFAGAVKDYGVATLVGEKTFGKGIVQNSYELVDGSVVKLTIAHYYTPKGSDIHGEGIAPDIVVEGEDEQLAKAMEILK